MKSDLLLLAKHASALLMAEAALLDAWARESKDGGWSTHQVDAQRRRADALRREAHSFDREVAKAEARS